MEWWHNRKENNNAWRLPVADLVLRDESGTVISVDIDRKNPREQMDTYHLPPKQLVSNALVKQQKIIQMLDEFRKEIRKK